MNWSGRSLRNRLLLWLLVPLFLLSLLVLGEEYQRARSSANLAYDRVLLGSALAIAERVVLDDDRLVVDVPYVALEMLTSAADDRVFYRILGPDEEFITGYRDLPSIPDEFRPLGDAPLFYDAQYRGDAIRVGSVTRFASNGRLSLQYTVQVAETVRARAALAQRFLIGAGLRQAALMIVVGLIVWFGVGRGLAPLKGLEAALGRRSSSDLRPIHHEVPAEIRQIVAAINSLLARLAASIEAQRRFIANASHQLRTPLAALKTQTELALSESDPNERSRALGHLQGTIRHTARLVQQLLSLARVEPDGGTRAERAPVDLAALAAVVTGEFVPTAVRCGIDLGLERAPDTPRDLTVAGDPLLLEELLRNLLENALTYCPAGSRVTVRLEAKGLAVEDTGPGLSETQYDAVFERFYRPPGSPGEGSGLGLAIVREIAEQHGGTIELVRTADEGGLTVRLRFGALAAAAEPAELVQAAQ